MKKITHVIIIVFFCLSFFTLNSQISLAVHTGNPVDHITGGSDVNPSLDGGPSVNPPSFSGSGSLVNPLKNITSITGFFLAILDILLVFAIPFVVFFIIYAGFMYVTARGNSTKIATAHNALLYAIIGGLLILGARLILNLIQGTVDEFISMVPLLIG
jgi:Type IV secretion system pilin